MHPISDRVFLAGALRAPRSEVRITVLNPSTGEPLGEIPDGTAADVDDAVAAAAGAAGAWSATPARERGAVLARLAGLLREHAEGFARLDSQDSGRTLAETRAQAARSAEQLEYCAGAADKLEGRVVPLGSNVFAATVLEPYGVIGALTPWNAPLLQIAQKTSHALAAGNTVVVKPSPLACFSTLHYAVLAGEGGAAGGRPQRGDGRRRHGAGAGGGRAGGQGDVHGIDGDRAADRGGVRGARGFGGARARGEVPSSRLRRRRPGACRGRDGAGGVRDDRPVLRLGGPGPRGVRLLRRVSRSDWWRRPPASRAATPSRRER